MAQTVGELLRYFQFGAVVSPGWKRRSNWQFAFQHFQFARRAYIHGGAKGFGPREIRTHTYTPLSRWNPAFRCVVTITVSRWTAAHSFRRPGNRYMYIPQPFERVLRIYRTGVENVSTLQRFARFSYLSSSRILSSRCYFFRKNNDIGLTMIVSVCLGFFS